MKKLLFTFSLVVLSLFSFAQYNSDNLKLVDNQNSNEHFSFENLRIFPIRANHVFNDAHKSIGNYTPLKEALEKKKLKISEITESGSVNKLMVKNESNDSIYIMAGEVVKGGKQDRAIAQDIIIAPGENVDVSAFCVEKGRWSYKGTSDFDGYYNVSSVKVRKAVIVDKNQGKVWQEVDDYTSKNKAGSRTGAYTELENSEDYKSKIEKYMTEFSKLPECDVDYVGIVAVTDGRVIGCDIFATHSLFEKAYSGLIHSYVSEAITNGEKVKVDSKFVETYLAQFLEDETKQEENLKGIGIMYEHRNKKLHFTSH